MSDQSVTRVVAALLVRGSQFLAAKRPEGVRQGGLWELPGGKVVAGESDAEALVREIDEELGVSIDVGARLGLNRHRYREAEIELVAYRATLTRGEPQGREHAELRWVDARSAQELEWAAADIPFIADAATLLAAR